MEAFELLLPCLQWGLVGALGAGMVHSGLKRDRAFDLARRAKRFEGKVVASRRFEQELRHGTVYGVTTVFAVPELGEFEHEARFDREGPALVHARIHRVDSVHPVVPDAVHPGAIFLVRELRRPRSSLAWGGLLLVLVSFFMIAYLLLSR
jgi:hypothetical protein